MERDYGSKGFYRSMKGYLHRRKYERLDGSTRGRKRVRVAKMGGGRKRKFWRLKMVPKLKIKWVSPKALLVKLRDAYVNMMLKLANSRVFSTEMMVGGFGPQYSVGAQPFGRTPIKEYDEKMIIEIYKSIMVQGQMQACRP